MPFYVKPDAFILLRVSGATVVFWFAGLFVKSQKIEKQDYKKIILASFFGIALNMLCFFKGLSLTSPIMVLIFSSILLKEKIIKRKIIGVFVGLIGAILLIVYGNNGDNTDTDSTLGNFLVFINAASYGLYLVLVKKLISKYHPITFIKWFYLFGLVLVIPFSFIEFTEISWTSMPTDIYLKVGFVIFFTTCITYLFNLYGLSKLKPTTVGVFIYLQPVIATIFALSMGSDSLSLVKMCASGIIFFGVYLVSKQPKNTTK